MKAPVVRKMQRSDVSSCAGMIARTPLFQSYGLQEEAARKILNQALESRSADLSVSVGPDHKPTGFAWFVEQGAFQRSAYLRLICVDPQTTQRGAGTALIQRFEKRNLEPYGIFLLVTKTNTGARRFYRKLGYRRVGEIPDYVKKGITECIYYKGPSKTAVPRSPD